MVLIFLCALVLLYLFGSQLLLFVLLPLTRAERIHSGPWDLSLKARKRKIPIIYLMDEAPLEAILLTNPWGCEIFVARKLWDRWENTERNAILYWVVSARLVTSNFSRFFLEPPIGTLDRNASLEADDRLALVGALEKAALERALARPGVLTGPLSGLSLLGPSTFQTWPTVEDRVKELTFHLSKVSKDR